MNRHLLQTRTWDRFLSFLFRWFDGVVTAEGNHVDDDGMNILVSYSPMMLKMARVHTFCRDFLSRYYLIMIMVNAGFSIRLHHFSQVLPNQIIIQKRLKNNLLYKNTILQKNAYCVYISSCTQREFKCKCFKNVFLSKTWFFRKSILNIHFYINFHHFQQTKATLKEFIICNVARILKSINLYAGIWIPATHEKYMFFLLHLTIWSTVSQVSTKKLLFHL